MALSLFGGVVSLEKSQIQKAITLKGLKIKPQCLWYKVAQNLYFLHAKFGRTTKLVHAKRDQKNIKSLLFSVSW